VPRVRQVFSYKNLLKVSFFQFHSQRRVEEEEEEENEDQEEYQENDEEALYQDDEQNADGVAKVVENLTVKALREYDDGPLTPDRENNHAEDYPDEDPELNNQPDGN